MDTVDSQDRSLLKPIFVFGTGRSGTTIFFQQMTRHPDVAWFSNYTNKTGIPSLAVLSRVRDVAILDHFLREDWRLTPKAQESVNLIRFITDGAFTLPSRTTAADVTPQVKARYHKFVKAHVKAQGKKRFIQKHTGFARTQYLQEVFPDAKFIHVVRDGRAVAYSLLNVRWWDGTMASWWWGDMHPTYREEYDRSGRDPLMLAGLVWKTLIDDILREVEILAQDAFYEIRYDHLITDPMTHIHNAVDFGELSHSAMFDQRVHRIRVWNSDEKWKNALSKRQIQMLDRSLGSHLSRFGLNC